MTFLVPPQCRVSAGLMILSKYTPVEFTIIKNSITKYKKKTQKVLFTVELIQSLLKTLSCFVQYINKPEDHWSCIAHLIAEDMLKSAVIEEKTFKHSRAGADNPLGPNF